VKKIRPAVRIEQENTRPIGKTNHTVRRLLSGSQQLMSCCTEPRPRQARSAEKEQGWTFLLTEHQRGNQSREGGQELGSGLHLPLDRSHLWHNWQTEAHLILRPKPRNRRGDFEAQSTKSKLPVLRLKPGNPPPPCFWGSTKKPTAGFEAKLGETVATSFEAKLEKTVTTGFEAKPAKTVATGFEAKSFKTVTTGFEVKLVETVRVVLRPNLSQTIAIGFEAQTDEKPSQWFWGQTTNKPPTLVLRLNQETRAPSLHVPGTDRTRCHLTSRPPGHRVPDLCDHPGPLHQVSYSCHDPRLCTPCRTCHLHIMRQANAILQMRQW
jgi:hypothetical protein